jgi:hypothetical protein
MINVIALFYFLFVGSLFAAQPVNLPALMSYPTAKEKDITSTHKNKVLVFLNRTCPCTQQNIPYINKLVTEFPEIEFIGVHSKKGSTTQEIKEIIETYKPQFPVIDDNQLEIANILKANRTPQVIILDKDNAVIYNGGVTDRTHPDKASRPYLKNALTELAANKAITEKETRSLGCVILR